MIVSIELSKYEVGFLIVHEVRWEEGGSEPAGEYSFSYLKRNENPESRIR
jgi:hypothetical protein